MNLLFKLKKYKGLYLFQCLFRGYFKHLVLYGLVIVTAMTGTSYYMYQQKKNTATSTLTLNYEEAAKGLYPNSTRFSISLIKSQEVLDRVIDKAGLEGITAEELAENITAKGVSIYNGQNSTSDYNIATSYVITYEKNPEISRMTADEMMKLIIQAYKEVFYEKYAYGKTDIVCDLEDYEELEYVEIADLFEREGNKISRYLKAKINENGTYQSETTKETFTSLKKLIDNFMDVDLEKYSSYIIQTGLAKDRDKYVSKLQYQNELLDVNYQKYMGEYTIRLSSIDIYDAALTSVVLIPTIDTLDEFYMSRTKVGIDYQAESAKSASSRANDIKEEIDENNYVISMLKEQSSQEDIQKAEDMIAQMKATLENITEKTVVTNREYIRYKTKNYLTVTVSELSIADLFSVKWMLLVGAAFLGVISIGIIVQDMRKTGEQ